MTVFAFASVLGLTFSITAFSGFTDARVGRVDFIAGQPADMTSSVEANDVNGGLLQLRFLDEATGYAVIPFAVRVKHNDDARHDKVYSAREIASNGTLAVPTYGGKVDITVEAAGYEPMSSFFTLTDEDLKVNFNLVPLNPPSESTVAAIAAKHRPNAMVVTGFVVDDGTGRPVHGASVRALDRSATTTTDVRGFFSLVVPLPSGSTDLTSRNTVLFSMATYSVESYSNFDMWPEGDVIFQVRLKKGAETNHVNVLPNRGASIVVLD